MSFENRERFSLETAREVYKLSGSIRHILDNQDGTYSVMSHIVCEHCDYCDEYNQWWADKTSQGLTYEQITKLDENIIHLPKPDPYEQQKVKYQKNYG